RRESISIFVWNPSVIPLDLVKRHMRTMGSSHEGDNGIRAIHALYPCFALPFLQHMNASPAAIADRDARRLYSTIGGSEHSSHPVNYTIPTALSQDSHAVILKIPKSIRTA